MNSQCKSIFVSSKTKLPSTIIEYNLGGETSNKIFYPTGIYALSPSLGGDSPPQVSYDDHLSIYKN